ncbi:hypothetical protein [Paenibacillus whitsoniae]|nr:hypothetical protein [Paenibacillus whitsoniae]
MKAILKSSQLSYELLERIALQVRAAKEQQAKQMETKNKRKKGVV